MLERLGRARYVAPLGVMLVISCVMALIIYPMLNAAPRGLPLGVVSLDEPVETPQGSMALGDALVEQMSSAGAAALTQGQESPVSWRTYETREELDEAFEAQEIYAGIVIPAAFTQARLATQTVPSQGQASGPLAGSADAQVGPAPLEVVVDMGRSPMAAQTIQTMLTAMLTQQGLSYELTTLHDVDLGVSMSTMALQFAVLPACMVTVGSSVALYLVTRRRDTAESKTAQRGIAPTSLAVQVGCAFVLTCILSWTITGILSLAGMTLPVLPFALFVWLASFGLMMLFVGCLDIAAPLGALVILACLGCGMACATLPPEMLPAFWQDWIYPWVPQHYLADGIRYVLFYEGNGVLDGPAVYFVAIAGVGLALMVLALCVRRQRRSL